MNIPCPCCGADVDAESSLGRGITINACLRLEAERVKLELQLKKTNVRIEPDVHADLVRRLEDVESALGKLVEKGGNSS